MRARRSSAPTFWLVAGPNGSGKSTLYGSGQDAIYGNTTIADVGRPFWIINPDLLALRISSIEHMSHRQANLEAVKRIEAWLETSINAHQSVGVETVLSTDKYRRLVLAAKRRKFEVRLVYVVLREPALNVERVRLRVRKGGHSVPARKVLERWRRSLDQLPWFLEQADWALLFDNSDELRAIGLKEKGTVILDPAAPKVIRDAVESIRTAGSQ